MPEFELEMLAPGSVLSPKEAVERVRERDTLHRGALTRMNEPSDQEEHEKRTTAETEAFNERQSARRFLRQHIYDTYGVTVDELVQLSRG